jgi:hypothetical protein
MARREEPSTVGHHLDPASSGNGRRTTCRSALHDIIQILHPVESLGLAQSITERSLNPFLKLMMSRRDADSLAIIELSIASLPRDRTARGDLAAS